MTKKANVGSIDRILRMIIGVLLIAAPFVFQAQLQDQTIISYAIPVVGIVLIATALFQFCPIYRLFGASTCKVN
ncbi:MAG: DUF2892 domain-containing protein [Rhizobiaceae bacterium]|nr:DUF2892 domain-containing protein [Rhizobiaceae bacterium]